MLKIAICEDIVQDALLLQSMVEEYLSEQSFEGEIAVFETGELFLAAFHSGEYQIAFLDIYLDEMDGMELARKLRMQDEELVIIFLTKSEAHAIESYAVRATHYLPKPAIYSQLCEAMDRCRQKLGEYSRSIEVYSSHSPVKIRLCDILYIETYQRNSVIHTVNDEIKTAMTMDALSELIGGLPFCRCHRSFLINLRKICQIERKEVILTNGARIPIGGVYAEAFRQEYSKLVASLTRVNNAAIATGGSQ
ncbi:LytTR family DNA-binding domain-containing protein [Christensenellaceae bacterium OttesenSCG-928-K19]|nr:LytTR family DNA-binding domain-containing protein [Christensenellaceae bacterium OttesenSCG-928-K19]